MTMYTPIPQPMSGDRWTRAQVIQFIVDNLNYLNSQIGGGAESFQVNEVVIGGDPSGLDGVALGNMEILIGTAGAPTALAAGTGFLRSVNGVVSYGNPDVSLNLADYVKYA